jgi:hypothetical protein
MQRKEKSDSPQPLMMAAFPRLKNMKTERNLEYAFGRSMHRDCGSIMKMGEQIFWKPRGYAVFLDLFGMDFTDLFDMTDDTSLPENVKGISPCFTL